MTTVIDFAKTAGDLHLRRNAKLDPIVAEIVFALLRCGGEAHRSVVADNVISARVGQPSRASEKERAELYEAFDRHLRVRVNKRPDPLVCLPFGPESYRWSLTPSARSALEELVNLPSL